MGLESADSSRFGSGNIYRFDDAVARGFGITFFLLGIYTLYFSLLWDVIHAGLFFFILAVSFWLLGRKAERIWHLEFLRDPKKPNDDMN